MLHALCLFNPKFEARNWSFGLPTLRAGPQFRNKSEIQIFECSKPDALPVEHLRFAHLDFDHLSIVSDFDIRISNFRVLRRIKTNFKVPRWEN